jgi:hypothetical protein
MEHNLSISQMPAIDRISGLRPPRHGKLSPLRYGILALLAWSALSLFWTADWDSTVTRVGTYLQLLVVVGWRP